MTPLTRAICALGALLVSACGHSSTPASPPSSPSCTYSIAGASFSFTATGGTGTVAVTTGGSCAWSARAESPWLRIDTGASVTGPGTVGFTVAVNADTTPRTGRLTVAEQAVAVTQDGASPCVVTISPSGGVHAKDAGGGTIAVSAPDGCGWTAVAGAAWITITAGARGTGNGTVSYAVSRNVDVAPRSAGITVADGTFSITQSGDTGACEYGVAPVEFSPCMPATEMSAVVTTQAGCPWTASTGDAWIAITSGASGSGSGPIVFRVGDNYTLPRSGQVLVRWPTPTAGQNIRIAQAGCRYTATPASITVAAVGGSSSFDVLQESDPYTCGGPLQNACTWSARADVAWITITSSMPRAGDDRVSFTVAPNTGPARRGTITVRDQVVSVTQGGIGDCGGGG